MNNSEGFSLSADADDDLGRGGWLGDISSAQDAWNISTGRAKPRA